mmetsp:Transcript_19505/g.45753  ORF Transcript_19505/g.45753 Transcript_19505/m.45753 type:complete len:491 (+) Transcript_19505:1856-3328(+)
MLRYAAAGYGDGSFAERRAEADNRVDGLGGTDLYVQSALVPNTRVRSGDDGADRDGIFYVGTGRGGGGNGTEVYGVVLSAAYVVNSTSSHYSYSTESALRGDLTVETPVAGTTAREFSFGDWDGFGLYPADDGSVRVDVRRVEAEGRRFAPAFGGGSPTVAQVSAISSAALGQHSPLAPSVFAQAMSANRPADGDGQGRFDERAAAMYDAPLLDKFAVCGQWPGTCGPDDGIFVDGGFADGPTLATNVAQFQLGGGDMDRTLRVIITNTNQGWGTDYQHSLILQYFDSPSNGGVEPGGFVWHPGFYLPQQSLRIFEEALDGPGLDALLEPIDGSNMTTALLSGTTIDSPSLGVMAGQSVEVLLINLNEPITTFVMTPVVIERNAAPLAEMARNVASNVELRARVRRFAEGGGGGSEIAGPSAGAMQGAAENDGGASKDVNSSGGDDAEGGTSGAGTEGAPSSDPSGGVSLVVDRRSIAVGVLGGIGLFLQ